MPQGRRATRWRNLFVEIKRSRAFLEFPSAYHLLELRIGVTELRFQTVALQAKSCDITKGGGIILGMADDGGRFVQFRVEVIDDRFKECYRQGLVFAFAVCVLTGNEDFNPPPPQSFLLRCSHKRKCPLVF